MSAMCVIENKLKQLRRQVPHQSVFNVQIIQFAFCLFNRQISLRGDTTVLSVKSLSRQQQHLNLARTQRWKIAAGDAA